MTGSHGKYVLLRGRMEVNFFDRFFTRSEPGVDPTRLPDGTLPYTIIGYVDSIEEAQIKLYGRSFVESDD